MATGNYNKFKVWLDGTVDFDNPATPHKVILLKPTHTFDKLHNFVADIVAQEVVATGYTRQALASRTVTEDDTNNRTVYDAADTAFGALGGAVNDSIRYAVAFHDTGSDATSELLCCLDFGVTIATNGGQITVIWNAAGLTYLQN